MDETSGADEADAGSMSGGQVVLPQPIQREMAESYINYAMSVIIGRALPDVRDGLKPVHRRILHAMNEGGYTHERAYNKSARSVGEVMGKYHPHGDQAIYDTMVRMVQEFSLRYPLVDGQGNFGSIDGDPPAAMRYTESRLDRLAIHLLQDIDKDTVDFQDNFDGSEQEPVVLPARLPNLLVNGSDGIAVGMATRIPPHNLCEVAAAIHTHVERILEEQSEDPGALPRIDIAEYMQHISGPDFPTGATIHGIDGVSEAYATGNGSFAIRSVCEIDEDGPDERIIVHEIPYQVNKSNMLTSMAELVSRGTLEGIRDIRDESNKEGIRIVIEVKRNADARTVLNQLYRFTQLQTSYSANMMGILDRKPVRLTLPVMLHTHVRHREEVIERRTRHDLAKAAARQHIVLGLLEAQSRIDEVIAAIRGSRDGDQARAVLQGLEDLLEVPTFSFSEAQTRAILQMRLQALTALAVGDLTSEHEELAAAIERFEAILASRPERLAILLAELDEVVARHGDERRTTIDPMPLDMDREEFIQDETIVISLSQENYLRHLPVDEFRLQHRGGKGVKGVTTKDEDAPRTVLVCHNKDRLLIFTTRGRVYFLKAWEIPRTSRHGRGTHVRNLLERLEQDEDIVGILPLTKELIEDTEGHYLMFATKRGRVKKTRLAGYVGYMSIAGKKAIKFASKDDMLVAVRHATDADHVVLVSRNGMACRFFPARKRVVTADDGTERVLHEVRAQGRDSQGVAGMNLDADDEVIGMIVTPEVDTAILTITRHGMAKRSVLGSGAMVPDHEEDGSPRINADGEPVMRRDGYRLSSRGTKGVRTMNVDDDDQIVAVRQVPDLDDQLFLLTVSGMMQRIPVHQTKETSGRATKGTRIMELRTRDRTDYADAIISAARLPAALVPPEINESDDEGAGGAVSDHDEATGSELSDSTAGDLSSEEE